MQRSASAFRMDEVGRVPAHDQEKTRTVLLLAKMQKEIVKQRIDLAEMKRGAEDTERKLYELGESVDTLRRCQQLLGERRKLRSKIARSSSKIDEAEEHFLKFQQSFEDIESQFLRSPSLFRCRKMYSSHGSASSLPVQHKGGSFSKSKATACTSALHTVWSPEAPAFSQHEQADQIAKGRRSPSLKKLLASSVDIICSRVNTIRSIAHSTHFRDEDALHGTKRNDSVLAMYNFTAPASQGLVSGRDPSA
eukprot:6172512-Pleurochrysis_carterae.AAC.9